MRTIRIFGLMSIAICFLSNSILSQTNSRLEAEKAWDALIKTKGGHEKLYSITNMLTEFPEVITRLDIFPNRKWVFSYTFRIPTICVTDGIKDFEDCAGKDGPINLPLNSPKNPAQDWNAQNRVSFLLETKWDKPEPQRITRIKQDKKNFDVIETIFEKKRIDFVFDPEEMLVTEVHFYDDEYFKGKLWQKFKLSDYTEIDGIKMPQSYAVGSILDKFDNLKYPVPIKFKFNVEFDPHLFERPLKATTPDAWKPQKL